MTAAAVDPRTLVALACIVDPTLGGPAVFLGKHLLVLLRTPSNGSYDAYATVTRAWSPGCANLLVVPDASLPVVALSVPVVEDLAAAQQLMAESNHLYVAYHPARPA